MLALMLIELKCAISLYKWAKKRYNYAFVLLWVCILKVF